MLRFCSIQKQLQINADMLHYNYHSNHKEKPVSYLQIIYLLRTFEWVPVMLSLLLFSLTNSVILKSPQVKFISYVICGFHHIGNLSRHYWERAQLCFLSRYKTVVCARSSVNFDYVCLHVLRNCIHFPSSQKVIDNIEVIRFIQVYPVASQLEKFHSRLSAHGEKHTDLPVSLLLFHTCLFYYIRTK